jgi:hypothetical protein
VSNPDLFYETPSSLATAFLKENLFKLGRPLWAGVYLTKAATEETAQIQELAERKILGRQLAEFQPTLKNSAGLQFTNSMKIAVFNMLVPLKIISNGQLSDELPANHMRYIVAISENREVVFSCYMAEPVLAYHAGMLMFKEPKLYPGELLRTLKIESGYGQIDTGSIGEHATAFLYILSRFASIRSQEQKTGDSNRVHLTTIGDLLTGIRSEAMSSLKTFHAAKTPSAEGLVTQASEKWNE